MKLKSKMLLVNLFYGNKNKKTIKDSDFNQFYLPLYFLNY